MGTLLLLQAQSLVAGLFTTESALGNFTFTGAEVDYDPDPRHFELHWSGDVSALAESPYSSPDDTAGDPLSGSLHIDTTVGGLGNLASGANGEFNFFGSIQPAGSLAETKLLQSAITDLKADSRGAGNLAFLVDQKAVTGSLASVYRGLGIFITVNGIDETNWINGFSDAAATVQLVSLEDGDRRTRNDAITTPVPLPGTMALLFAGLLPLLRRRAA